MKDPSLSWLLDPKDPPVRHQALIDLLHRPKDGKDVLAARDEIPSYRPVKKIIGTRTSAGIWSPKEPVIVQNGQRPSGPLFFSEKWMLLLIPE